MSGLLAVLIFCGMDVYFLKDSPDLLVRIIPYHQTEQVTLRYSFSGDVWGSVEVKQQGRFFDATVRTPLDARIIGVYSIYGDGTVDDKDGQPYWYEVSVHPRMLMPFSLADLEVVIAQADKKITARTHVDEAIALLDYAGGILAVLPVVPDTPAAARKAELQGEVSRLKALVRR